MEQGHILLDDGAVIPAHTLIWTTGIRGSRPASSRGHGRFQARQRSSRSTAAHGSASACSPSRRHRHSQNGPDRPVPAVAQGLMRMGQVATVTS